MKFTELDQPRRITAFFENKNTDDVYDLLEKHLGIPIDELKQIYTVDCDYIKNRIFIKSDGANLVKLFTYLLTFDVKFESIQEDQLRIDIYEFLYKIK